MTDYHDVGADTCASQPGQWRVMWRFLGMLFYGGIFMTRFLIRFLGGFFAFVGLGTLADSAVADDVSVCDGVKLQQVSNGIPQTTSAVVSRALVTGAAWYVGWPNSEYSEMDYGPRPALWYDMDGYYDFFDKTDAFADDWWQIPWNVNVELADSRLQNGCILAPDTDRICSNYYSDGKVAGVFCAGCAISARSNDTNEVYDDMPGVLFAEASGLFKDYGCCQYGATGVHISKCPCLFASTEISGLTVTDMNGNDHDDVTHVVPHIVTFNFLNCPADEYQGVDANGYSMVLPWVSAEDASGAGTGMLIGRVKFVFQPGFWNDDFRQGDYGAGTDAFYDLSNECTFSDVYIDKIYGLSGAARCTTAGCESAFTSSGYWFNPSACYSCRTLDGNYSSNSGKMEFYPTVDMGGSGTFLRSTFGRESCHLKKIGPIKGTNGSYEYSCNSYYTE